MSSAYRLPWRLLAGLASTVLLAGCGGDEEPGGSPAATSTSTATATSTPADEPREPDLASGLLPAEAFGPEATVVAVSPEQLEQGAGLAAEAEELQITPESCRATVDGMQPDIYDFEDIAAQTATTGASSTVEMLMRGGPLEDTVAQLAEAAERCPTAQMTSPEIGQATVTFENLPVEDLGDGAALLRYTTSLSAPDGSQVSLPTLIGAVEDGDRLLLLVNIDAGQDPAAATDPAAFADLLEQAYEAQADALG
ncbi:hypothetical protein [Blastococcus saxobsidens]|uniref:DUF5642 domain-containing protein n=1 Tax=Blastococcus saxobsidens (strain DD2) TaxID=1146883 RepID=H6RS15_BLASD|nr:hypothetical protein [Blastococcus saxobsidens]CCG04209.1 conserved exported protein of unknown function [Blastococcus saxobsidens DD2]